MPKKPTVKAHRGFIHIPRRGRGPRRPPRFPGFPGFPGIGGPRRPPRFPGFPGFPRFPGIGGPRRPIRQPVRPPRGPLRPRGPRVDPSPDIRRDPKKLKDFMRRQRERDRAFIRRRSAIDRNTGLMSTPQSAIDDLRRRQREQQRAADNFRRLRDIAFRRSTSAQRRAKGGAMVKPKDYVNPSSTIDRRKKK